MFLSKYTNKLNLSRQRIKTPPAFLFSVTLMGSLIVMFPETVSFAEKT